MLREIFPGETKDAMLRLREARFRWPPDGDPLQGLPARIRRA